MTKTTTVRRIAGAVGAVVALAVPFLATQAASAATRPAVDPAPTSVTLPLFGAPLTVDITTDGTGSLTNVAVNPADGLTATTLKPNRVVFQNTGGTATVTVTNRDGRQSVSVRAGTLADLSGSGRWSGDVFETGTPTMVDYTVGDRGDGTPDITGVSTSDATAVVGATRYSVEDDEQEARASIAFSSGSQTRSVSIKVKVSTSDGTPRATLRISLGRVHGVPQPAADVAGPHSWDGQLCDGTLAHIDYTVALDGTISVVSATPTPASIRTGEHSVQVRFSQTERVHLRAELEDGLIALDVFESFRCGGTPGTNATIGTESGDDRGQDDDHEGSDDHATGPHGESGAGASHDDENEDEHESEGSENHSGSDHSSGPRGESGRNGGERD
jgi:hypothetical protein